ncbi:MAG: hypothetical protein RMI56_04475 [Sulfolobales archaeon]|nr:hypothetical protein [Sulfolobales archaeon]
MRSAKPLSLLLAVTVLLVTAAAVTASRSSSTDCLFLMFALDRVLDYVLRGDSSGEVLAQYLLNAPLPEFLRSLHARTYRLVLDYYAVVSSGTAAGLAELRKLSSGLGDIGAYAGELSKCSHDPEAARVLKSGVESKLSAIAEVVNLAIENAGRGACGDLEFSISPRKSAYLPGDSVEVGLASSREVPFLEVYTWPQLTLVERIRGCGTSPCYLKLGIPGARALVELGLEPSPVSSFALVAKLGNSTCVLGLIKVAYSTPDLRVELPRTARRGDPVLVSVDLRDEYEVSAYLNGVLVYGSRASGRVVLEVDTGREPVTLGLNELRVCVSASLRTLPKCFRSVFTVEPRQPKVEVHVPRVVVSWFGYATISIVSGESGSVSGTVLVNGVRVRDLVIEGPGTAIVTALVGVLPVQRVPVVADFSAAGYDRLVLSYEVVSFNVASTLATVFAAVLLSLSVSSREKLLTVVVAGALRPGGRLRRFTGALAGVLKPYALGLGSSIALLYYDLLKKLKVRQPLEPETLREHFRNSVEPSALKSSVKNLLRRMLELVERDLYSRRKPDYGEASGVYRGVVAESKS